MKHLKEEEKPQRLKEKRVKEKKGTKKKTALIIGAVAAVAAAGAVILLWRFKNPGQPDFPGTNRGGGMSFATGEGITAVSGVINVGITEESFEVEKLSTELEIEEVYISSEDVLEEGMKVLKLSQEDVAEAREELEQTLRDAELAYRAGTIEYEQKKITAQYDRDSKELSGVQAKEIYEETLAELETAVEKAHEQVTDSKEQISEYQSYVLDNSYRSYFRVDEYQAAYDETLAALEESMEEWGYSWSQVVGQGGGQGKPMAGSASGDGGRLQALTSLYSVLEQQLKKLEQAESEYEEALQNAAFELQTLELELPGLEQALEEAEKEYQTQALQAKVTYETSLADAENAQKDYETEIEQAETSYESLKKDWEEAQENLQLFEESVGDGYYYASGSGTVLRTMVRAGRYLTSESILFMYSNPAEMTVTVSVDQTEIAKIAPGDSVYIQSAENSGYEGSVTEINPISASDSRTNVTYSVVVRVLGDTAALSANESVVVVFGMDAEMIQRTLSGGEGKPGGAEQPEGLEKPEGLEQPEGMEQPEEMEKPEGTGQPEGLERPEGMEPPGGREPGSGKQDDR